MSSAPSYAPAGPASTGSLYVTTNPSPLAVTLLDRNLSVVAHAVSPVQFSSLPQGLYAVSASRAGKEDFRAVTRVVANAVRSVHLSGESAGLKFWLSNLPARAFDQYARRLVTPTLVCEVATDANKVKLHPFYLRFVRMYDWNCAEITDALNFSKTVSGSTAVLDVTNAERRVTFAQVAGAGLVRNVALPPGSPEKPARFQMIIDSTDRELKVRVKLSTDWANSALQYMMQGYLDQALLVVTGTPQGTAASTPAPKRSYDDAAASLVPRYLGLRLGDASVFNSSEGGFVAELNRVSDGLILTAELAARSGRYRLAASSLLKIRPGALPLFTEGYSLLVQRLRDLTELDDEDVPEDERLTAEVKSSLVRLRRSAGRWSTYIDLDSPTLVFPGENPAKPSRAGAAEDEGSEAVSKSTPAGKREPKDGWTLVDDSIVTSLKGVFTMGTGSTTGSVAASGPSWPELGPVSGGTGSGFPVGLIQEIDEFVATCDHNYHFNSRADTLLNVAGIALSVGIVIAGVLKRSDYATVLGAVMTAAVTAQRAFPFNQRWQFYRTLLSQAENLSTKAKSGSIGVEQAVQALANLRLDFAQQIPRGATAATEQKATPSESR